MPLAKKPSLIIASQAIGPFVDITLLKKLPNNSLEPIVGTETTSIDKILKRLSKLDDEYDIHTITSILEFISRKCYDAGYSLAMGVKDLLNAQQISTVDELADEISRRTTKA